MSRFTILLTTCGRCQQPGRALFPPFPNVVLAAGRAAFRVAALLQLSQLIGRIEEERKEEAEC